MSMKCVHRIRKIRGQMSSVIDDQHRLGFTERAYTCVKSIINTLEQRPSEAYSKSNGASKIELFVKIVNHLKLRLRSLTGFRRLQGSWALTLSAVDFEQIFTNSVKTVFSNNNLAFSVVPFLLYFCICIS